MLTLTFAKVAILEGLPCEVIILKKSYCRQISGFWTGRYTVMEEPTHVPPAWETSYNPVSPKKGHHLQKQMYTYSCLQQHHICFLQGTWDTVCPHMPSWSPVKHQREDSEREDGSNETESFPTALSLVAKYFLKWNRKDSKCWSNLEQTLLLGMKWR